MFGAIRSRPRREQRPAAVARGEVVAQRRQPLQPGEAVGQGHVFAEHDRVHLVVAAQQLSVAGDEGGRVENLHARRARSARESTPRIMAASSTRAVSPMPSRQFRSAFLQPLAKLRRATARRNLPAGA